MEKARKNLKEFSYLILFLLGLSLIRSIINLIVNGVNIDAEKANLPQGLVMPIVVITIAAGFVLFIPQLYVGLKGLKLANGTSEDDTFKAPIVWATILLVAAAFSIISPVQDLASNTNVIASILAIIDYALDVVVYFLYIKFAKQVLKGA